MFILFPFLYQRTGFWLTLGLSCLITIVLFMLWAGFLKKFGIDLL